MNEKHQISKHTEYNRYPNIFLYSSTLIKKDHNQKLNNDPIWILSFGCSSGHEVRTLRDIYFPSAFIVGVDIDEEIIKKNQNENKDEKIIYMTSDKLMASSLKFDIIFCMSVFCVWPEHSGEYYFNTFEKSLVELDNYLKKNGYIVIYNSKYLFTETKISKKYETANNSPEIKGSGFVKKYLKSGQLEKNYPHCFFKKIN